MNLKSDYIEEVSYIPVFDEKMKIVVIVGEYCRNCILSVKGEIYPEKYNYSEPYDYFTHVFILPAASLNDGDTFLLNVTNAQEDSDYFDDIGQLGDISMVFSAEKIQDIQKQYAANDSCIAVIDSEEKELTDGVSATIFDCKDKNEAPVKAFLFKVDVNKASFYCGTPFDGIEYVNKKQTVEGEARAARNNGVNVIGAVNADFFDMFGDCRPSGLCVKSGVTVANAKSDNPFFAVLKDGRAIISDFAKNRVKLEDIYHAVSGRPILLRDGVIVEYQPLEPFGFTRHPRTAVGVCPDGTVLVLVIDGRLPAYSNGATLLDVALFMKKLGACDALNLDGGGSCTFLIANGDEFDLINNPADLFRPADKLIRDVFDSLLIIK